MSLDLARRFRAADIDVRLSLSRDLPPVWGDADQLNPYNGGYASGGRVNFAPVDDTIQFWVEKNGCPQEAQVDQTGSILHASYTPCAQGSAVELYHIVGGEHAWPGGESVSAEIGAPTTEISATPLIWAFFKDHPMP